MLTTTLPGYLMIGGAGLAVIIMVVSVICCYCYCRKAKRVQVNLDAIESRIRTLDISVQQRLKRRLSLGLVASATGQAVQDVGSMKDLLAGAKDTGMGAVLKLRIDELNRWLIVSIWKAWNDLVHARQARAVWAEAMGLRKQRDAMARDKKFLGDILNMWRLEISFEKERASILMQKNLAQEALSTPGLIRSLHGFNKTLGSLFTPRQDNDDSPSGSRSGITTTIMVADSDEVAAVRRVRHSKTLESSQAFTSDFLDSMAAGNEAGDAAKELETQSTTGAFLAPEASNGAFHTYKASDALRESNLSA